MPDKQVIIVNYHYIRERSPDHGIHAIAIRDFESQLGHDGPGAVLTEAIRRPICDLAKPDALNL